MFTIMSAAEKLHDVEHVLTQVDDREPWPELGDFPALSALFRERGPRLVELFELLNRDTDSDSSQAGHSAARKSGKFEDMLRARGVSQGTLSAIALCNVQRKRGRRIARDLLHGPNHDLSERASELLREYNRASWEHLFGLLYFAFVASGAIPAGSAGENPVLVWMRKGSNDTYLAAADLERELSNAA